jgi:hypothetical protein
MSKDAVPFSRDGTTRVSTVCPKARMTGFGDDRPGISCQLKNAANQVAIQSIGNRCARVLAELNSRPT